MTTRKLLFIKSNYLFARCNCNISTFNRISNRDIKQLLNAYPRNWYSYARISTCRRNETASKEPTSKESTIPSKDSENASNNKSKSKLMYFGAGSIVLAGSLVSLWYARSKRKKSGEPPIKEIKKIEGLKIPEDSKDIPGKIPYLLIGGGTASFSAFRAIKASDPVAKVLMITDELYYPYMRPPLTKEMWFADDESAKTLSFKQWNGVARSVFYEPDDFYLNCTALENDPKGGIAVARGWTVVKILPFEKKVILDDGKEVEYEKCLIATGGRARNLPAFEEAGEEVKKKITLFRTVDDFKRLHSVLKEAKSLAVIGGSFAGSELASSIAFTGKGRGLKVTQIFPENGIMGDVLPHYLSLWSTNKCRDIGVNINSNTEIDKVSLSSDKKQLVLHLSNGNKLNVDHAVLAVGAVANTDLAEPSGLETHPELGGFVVNTELQARSNLYSAGDCSCFYDTQFGRRRIDHHDNAVISGRLAGENMVNPGKPYWHQSMFWSDLGPDISYEGIGIIDSSLPTVGIFAKPSEDLKTDNSSNTENKSAPSEPKIQFSTSKPKDGENYDKGVIFYLQDGIVVGIILWNLFNRMTVARQVLNEKKKFDDFNEVAKFFELHRD